MSTFLVGIISCVTAKQLGHIIYQQKDSNACRAEGGAICQLKLSDQLLCLPNSNKSWQADLLETC